MTNLWGFLLQTSYITLVGGLLLLVKWLLRDKLPPRWQYLVWVILAVRIVIPVNTTGNIVLLPLPLWVETVKTVVEQGLSSAYTSFYEVIRITTPIPWLRGRPVSVTDWLFVFYVAGVAAALARYLVSYLRLRRLLRQGMPGGDEIVEQVWVVGARYRLPVFPVVVLSGLPSPMVCGVLRPVLVLPAGERLDDHVILHELLHVKHFDALQNVFWSFCRALHWCNPVIQWMLNRVGNDLEALCDQRVLERLEGEERRRYGIALLAMANDRYPRAPGTTSISNGGRNISRRIEAIVRFQRYPKGMVLASVCVTLLLLSATMTGTAAQEIKSVENWDHASGWDRAEALASLRLTHCSTVAGALDTYAKGMITGEKSYLAIASPKETRALLEQEISQAFDQGSPPAPEEFGKELMVYDMEEGGDILSIHSTGRVADISLLGHVKSYVIHNLREEPNGTMTAQIAFSIQNLQDFSSPELMGWREDLSGLPGVAWYGVRLTQEEGWVVECTGPRILYLGAIAEGKMYTGDLAIYPAGYTQQAVGEYGTVTRKVMAVYTVAQDAPQDAWGSLFGFFGPTLSSAPNPHGAFGRVMEDSITTCEFDLPKETEKIGVEVGLQVANKKKLGPMPSFLESMPKGDCGWGTEFGGTQGNAVRMTCGEDWTGRVSTDGWHFYEPDEYDGMEFATQIWWNGEPVETLLLKDIPMKEGE
ncbi:MAG: M56 family metallopeptidase [Vescimonas coprocola]|nr:M56 family metallopeptidase [Clostridiales bacterium]MDY2967752.1 M56 family metallopeptidase [Vescimonas coprocola]